MTARVPTLSRLRVLSLSTALLSMACMLQFIPILSLKSAVILLVAIPIIHATSTSVDTGFLRDQCFASVRGYLADGTLDPNDEVFFRDADGRPMSGLANLTLTLSGCRKLCGCRQSWYPDIGERLSVWLLPVLLLISNVELSPLDKRRFSAIIHLIGDPIHSFWSLLDKLDACDRCYRLAEQRKPNCQGCTRVIATVFAGFEEMGGSGIVSRRNLYNLTERYHLTTHFGAWKRAALDLADSRTDELFRTWLAIALYIYQLIGGFVEEIGGEPSSPPGGRIATSVFLSWLVPVVLLSNAIGNFPSPYTCPNVLSRFVRSDPRSPTYAESLPWSGGIYTFRPWRRQYHQSGLRAMSIFAISIFPVCIGMLGGFVILWNLIPNGLNCRHVWMMGVFAAWAISALVSKMAYTCPVGFLAGKHRWYFILTKDALIGVPSITIIFLSACGLFNSCNCWSGYLYHRRDPRVALNVHSFFERNDHTVYPLVFGVCLAAQLTIFGIVTIVWRRGFRVLRWSKSLIREEQGQVMDQKWCMCMTHG